MSWVAWLPLWIAIAVIGAVIIAIIAMYNTLIVLRARVNNGWAQIDVQLKRRADLIPNLVECVKGYMRHEREVLQNVTRARTELLKATTPTEAARADNLLTGALKTLFAVAENYPALRATENFRLLQEELAGTENKIAYARQFYNDSVMEFNARIGMFPWLLIAKAFAFTPSDYFEIPPTERVERAPVRVRF